MNRIPDDERIAALEARIGVLEACLQLLLSQTTPEADQRQRLRQFLHRTAEGTVPRQAIDTLLDGAEQLYRRRQDDVPWPKVTPQHWKGRRPATRWFAGPRGTVPIDDK